jgi:hypothetical protein
MPTQLELSPDELLNAVAQLDASELDSFTSRVLALRARRVAPLLPAEEEELVRRINALVPLPEAQRRFDLLVTRRRAKSLTPAEYEELLMLTEQIERNDADRLELLARLAQLRGVALRDVIQQLGLKPHAHA